MSSETHRISKAFFASLTEGVVELTSDWRALRLPHLSIEGELVGHLDLVRLPPSDFAGESRYFVDGQGRAVFTFDPSSYPYVDYDSVGVYVAGPFNGWQEAVGQEAWQLKLEEIDGKPTFVVRCPMAALGSGEILFKFVTDEHAWLPVDPEAPNVAHDGQGNSNYVFSDRRSGRHRFRFALQRPVDLSEVHYLIYHGRVHSQRAFLEPGPFFYELKSDKMLGAIVGDGETVFRLFAPRAKWVKVGFFMPGESEESISWVLMERSEDFVWETTFPRKLVGAYYWFRLDGPEGSCSLFDPEFKILDPYAKATVSREGPGIVVDDRKYAAMPAFHPVAWQDLVTMEAHTRDLVAGLPEFSDVSRPLGFADLERYVESDAFYPKSLGANALELQPVQENDSQSYGEYHWGYMTANFFSPASSYATDPLNGSQVEEFRSLVTRLHEQGMAVILDVVYNHVGEPAHLMFIDKLYYFHLEQDGNPVNWSGCGNDLRCDAPMARRIIIESLKHFALFYGVDGFRFDLADLVGKPVLQEIERELKAVKPDIILIAEPWSFRGHIGRDLRDTGFASWNDGYRESLKEYVNGEASAETLAYYLQGSAGDYASWPSQTVNYTESHDDRVWIDEITEQGDQNGSVPTINDLRRTHMMGAIMMMSIGMPLFHAGQDFLFSKKGVRNTYQQGDLNALDYGRRFEFASTSEYFRAWIEFRKSELGSLVRHFSRATDGFFEFERADEGNAMVCLYNADRSQSQQRLLFAVNPDLSSRTLSIERWKGRWTQLADRDRFWGLDPEPLRNDVSEEITISPLGCGLWLAND